MNLTTPSLGLLESLGFEREGRKREAHLDGERYANIIILGLLKEEFRSSTLRGKRVMSRGDDRKGTCWPQCRRTNCLRFRASAWNMTWYLVEHSVKRIVSVSNEQEDLENAQKRTIIELYTNI